MKRNIMPGQGSLREDLMSSKNKRQAFGLLLEELSRPEIDIPLISNHTSTVMAHMKQRNAMVIPIVLDMIQKENEPLVLEITQNVPAATSQVGDSWEEDGSPEFELSLVEEAIGRKYPTETITVEDGIIGSDMKLRLFPQEDIPLMEEQSNEPANFIENVYAGGKQFEIIFADSTRPTDIDSEEHHIIHSTTERSATSSEAPGTVNVPNSFPLFQLVHAGEVPEEMQREIEQKIRQANPELDLNSITFKFKSPETVEIIANVNT